MHRQGLFLGYGYDPPSCVLQKMAHFGADAGIYVHVIWKLHPDYYTSMTVSPMNLSNPRLKSSKLAIIVASCGGMNSAIDHVKGTSFYLS